MCRAGTPTDNPVNESLNGWIKEELILGFKFRESNDSENTIKDCKIFKAKTFINIISEILFFTIYTNLA